MSDQTSTPEEKDLTLQELHTADAIVRMGQIAASMLQSFGCVTFLVDEQENIRIASPYQVYVDSRLAHPPEGVAPRFVRPILTNGKPQYVAKNVDGSLWEVEYPEQEIKDLDDAEEMR